VEVDGVSVAGEVGDLLYVDGACQRHVRWAIIVCAAEQRRRAVDPGHPNAPLARRSIVYSTVPVGLVMLVILKRRFERTSFGSTRKPLGAITRKSGPLAFVGASTPWLFSASVMPSVLPSSTYSCRFRKRARQAFKMRSRYNAGDTTASGQAVPLV
jgi:hypothetical protein